MKVTPLDIRKQQFKKVMRGYDPVEVDTFLEMVAADMEEILRTQKDSRDREVELDTQLKDYRQIEKTLQQTLLQAQEVTGKTYETARRDAEGVIRDAESRARQIIENAHKEATRLNNEVEELRLRRESLLGRLKVLLSSELELLKSMDQGAARVMDPSTSLGSGKERLDIDTIVNSLEHDRPA